MITKELFNKLQYLRETVPIKWQLQYSRNENLLFEFNILNQLKYLTVPEFKFYLGEIQNEYIQITNNNQIILNLIDRNPHNPLILLNPDFFNGLNHKYTLKYVSVDIKNESFLKLTQIEEYKDNVSTIAYEKIQNYIGLCKMVNTLFPNEYASIEITSCGCPKYCD